MTDLWQPPVVTLRCELIIDGVRHAVLQHVAPEVWHKNANLRTTIEDGLRRELGAAIALKLAPPVVAEQSHSGLRRDHLIEVAEALRIAQAHEKALAALHERIKEAGLGFAWVASREAAAAAHALVEELQSTRAQLPEVGRPGSQPG